MDFLELVRKRHSTRKYAPTPVPRDILEFCIEAARLAPSACNSQPWSFIIIDDEVLKNEVADGAFGNIYSMNMFAKSAPVIVAVITGKSKVTAGVGGFFMGIQYSYIDVGIAVAHFVLQAAEKGLGSCMLGWFNEKKVRNILKLPRSSKISMLISIGYPETDHIPEKKRKSPDEIRRYN